MPTTFLLFRQKKIVVSKLSKVCSRKFLPELGVPWLNES
uniref:Uncharacterized protein n=1 Tax=Arundo donax TaxID=35708 RepID=A0A0A8ZYE1_ARUDO